MKGPTLCAIKDRPYYCLRCGRWYGGWIWRDGIWQGCCWTCDYDLTSTALLSKRQEEG